VTKLGKKLGGAKQRQLARKEVQQISAPPTCTSTAEISDGGSTGLRLLASGRGGWSPPSPTAGSVPEYIIHIAAQSNPNSPSTNELSI